MSGNVIGTATIQIIPDVTRFTAELKSQISAAIAMAEMKVKSGGEEMEGVFRELANVVRGVGAEIRATMAYTSDEIVTQMNSAGERSEAQIKASGEAIESAIRETGTTAEIQGERIERAYAEAGRKAHGGFLTGAKMMGGAIATYGVAMMAQLGGSAIKAGFEMTGTFDRALSSFTALTGSITEGKKLLEDVKGFAFKSPFDVKEVADITRNLLAQGQAYGVTKDNVLQYATAIGDAIAITGGGEQEFSRVVRALGQMGSSSKVMAQDMNQLQQSIPGINVWQALADGLGVTQEQARDMGQHGLIPGAQAANILVDAMRKMPGAAGEMERQAMTLTGALQNFKEQALASFTEGLRPFTDALKTMLADPVTLNAVRVLGEGFSKLLVALSPLLPVVLSLAQVFGGFLGALGTALTPFINAIAPVLLNLLSALSSPLNVLATTFGMLLTALSPIITIFAELITVGAQLISNVLIALQPAIKEIGAAFQKMLPVIIPLIQQMAGQLKPVLLQIADAFVKLIPALLPLLPSLIKLSMSMVPITLKLLPIFADLLVTITDLLVQLLPAILPVIDGFANLSVMLGNMLATVAGGIASALSWIIGGLATIFATVTSIISGFITGVMQLLGIASPSKVFLDIGKNLMLGLLNGVQSLVGAVLGFFLSLPGRIISAVSSILSLILNTGKGIIMGLWNGLSSMFGWLQGLVGGIPGKIVSFIGNVGSTLYNVGSSLISGLWNGISSLDIVGKVRDLVNSVKSKIGEVVGALNPFKSGKLQAASVVAPITASLVASSMGDTGVSTVTSLAAARTQSGGDIVFNGPVVFGSDASSSVAELSWFQRTRMGAA